MTLGTPLSEQVGTQYRYSLVRQRITLDPALTVHNDQSGAGMPANGKPPPGQAGGACRGGLGVSIGYTLSAIRSTTSETRQAASAPISGRTRGVGGDGSF